MSFYDTLRHFADSYGLAIMFGFYLLACGWYFLPHASRHVDDVKNSIFKEDDHV
jgi:cytochrome c oxidase cbb3-type subunit 4